MIYPCIVLMPKRLRNNAKKVCVNRLLMGGVHRPILEHFFEGFKQIEHAE